jgi:hypothetical protein
MASFRLFDRLQTFYGLSGQLLAGGYIKTYTAATTNPQNVYGEKALTTNNGSQVALDSSGRLVHDVWADTADGYFVEVYDADDVKQGEADNVEIPGSAVQTIPIPGPGEFIGGDGTNLITVDLSTNLLPDQTGHSNQILGTDGTTAAWVARPADGATGASANITVTANSVKWDGGATKVMEQFNTSTATNSNTRTCSKAITFPTAFTATPVVSIVPTFAAAPTTGGNVYPHWDITAVSTTGFTVTFSTYTGGSSADSSSSNAVISADVPFAWTARGTVA